MGIGMRGVQKWQQESGQVDIKIRASGRKPGPTTTESCGERGTIMATPRAVKPEQKESAAADNTHQLLLAEQGGLEGLSCTQPSAHLQMSNCRQRHPLSLRGRENLPAHTSPYLAKPLVYTVPLDEEALGCKVGLHPGWIRVTSPAEGNSGGDLRSERASRGTQGARRSVFSPAEFPRGNTTPAGLARGKPPSSPEDGVPGLPG